MAFTCELFANDQWNSFVEQWASVAHAVVLDATGPFDREPSSVIARAPEQNYQDTGFTGMYLNGQIFMHPSLQGDPGKTLRVITHEMLHASLDGFPSTDVFYAEGFVDYATMVLAQREEWAALGTAMIADTQDWAEFRQAQALKCRCDIDAKRWMGFVFAATAYAEGICDGLKAAKSLRPRSWWLPRTPTEMQACAGPYKACPK
jgi:hypothetical protein